MLDTIADWIAAHTTTTPTMSPLEFILSVGTLIVAGVTVIVLIGHLRALERQVTAARESTERTERNTRDAFSLKLIENGREARLRLLDPELPLAAISSTGVHGLAIVDLSVLDSASEKRNSVLQALSFWEQLAVGAASGAVSITIADKSVGGRAIDCWERASQVIRHRKRMVGARIYDQFDRFIDTLLELRLCSYRLDASVVASCRARYFASDAIAAIERMVKSGNTDFATYGAFSQALMENGLPMSDLTLLDFARHQHFSTGLSASPIPQEQLTGLYEQTRRESKGIYPPKTGETLGEWVTRKSQTESQYLEFVARDILSKNDSKLLAYLRLARMRPDSDPSLHDHLSRIEQQSSAVSSAMGREPGASIDELLEDLVFISMMGRAEPASGGTPGLGRLVFRKALRYAREIGISGARTCVLSVIDDEVKNAHLGGALKTYYREGGIDLGTYKGGKSGYQLRAFLF